MIEAHQETRSEQPAHFLDELRATFAAYANKQAICYKDHSITYGELDARARSWAWSLRDAGVEPGDRVAIITSEKPRLYRPIWEHSMQGLSHSRSTLGLHERSFASFSQTVAPESLSPVKINSLSLNPYVRSLRTYTQRYPTLHRRLCLETFTARLRLMELHLA